MQEEGPKYQPFYIKSIGAQDGMEPGPEGRMDPSLTAFVYLTGGELLAEADGRTFLCSAWHLLLIPPGMSFSVHYHESCIGFSGYFQLSVLPDPAHPLLHGGEPFLYGFWFEEAALVAELFGMMASHNAIGHHSLVGKGLDLILSIMDDGKGSGTPPLVSSFLDRVFDHSSSPSSVASYASMSGVTPSYLNKLVKASTGRTASAWIDISRLNIAKNLLSRTDMAIIDIAAATGIDDQSYFSRFFKRSTGTTPSKYRKLSKDSNE